MLRLPFFAATRGVFAALALALSTGALAHALPKQTDPVDASVVSPAPKSVSIEFTETLEPAFSSIVVVDAAGRTVSAGKAAVDASDHKRMSVGLDPVAAGVYTVQWTALATDGHHTHGSYRFSVK